MSDSSPNLALPFLLSNQIQKHLTINDAINKIDGILMLAVKSRKNIMPPSNPQNGERYIIAENGVGNWENKANQIAFFVNLGWDFIEPNEGFVAFCEEDNEFIAFIDGTWRGFPISTSALQNLMGIGIGTSFDANNPISAKANNILFCAKYLNELGSGDLRIKLNKEQNNKSASFIFQSNWVGHAEFGLFDDNAFSLKTSSDGQNWNNAISINTSDGITTFSKSVNFNSIIDGANELVQINKQKFLFLPRANGTAGNNIFIGQNSGSSTLVLASAAYDASYNSGYGASSLSQLTTGFANSAFGYNTLNRLTTGVYNTAVGNDTLQSLISGSFNTAIGKGSLYNCLSNGNTSIGVEANLATTVGSYNTSLGCWAGYSNVSGNNNSAFGINSLRWRIDGSDNTNFSSCTGLGTEARVSGSNQVQLGGPGTNCYAYGAVQDRSDIRDKADIRDTVLGLAFVNALRPVDFKWDMRDDYFENQIIKDEIGHTQSICIPINKDGSKKRNRFHHGLIAQEVESVLDRLGIDFGGFQDHTRNGGCDVKSIGYGELIAPIIRAIQEVDAKITNLQTNLIQFQQN